MTLYEKLKRLDEQGTRAPVEYGMRMNPADLELTIVGRNALPAVLALIEAAREVVGTHPPLEAALVPFEEEE